MRLEYQDQAASPSSSEASVGAAPEHTEATPTVERKVLALTAEKPGPRVIITAGIHGNEPAGVDAIRRLARFFDGPQTLECGSVIALIGNIGALNAGERYLERDLNRSWSVERVARLQSQPTPDGLQDEDFEQWHLLREIDRACDDPTGPVYFLDLHTTSGDGPPFMLCRDTLPQRNFALRLIAPLVLGLEERLDGALLDYMSAHGATCMAFEGGQHEAPDSPDHHEALLLLFLAELGMIAPPTAARELLERVCAPYPAALSVHHRHAVAADDQFVMRPGYRNFDAIRPREVLAHDRNGPIEAVAGDRLLMPLYQGLGSDGYFIGNELSPFYLAASGAARGLRLERFIGLLPGVRVLDDCGDHLRVQPRAEKRWASLFRFLGYRKIKRYQDHVTVSRRHREP